MRTRIQTFTRSFVRVSSILIAAILFFTGCASRKEVSRPDPFGAIGTDSDVYIYSPVKGNEKLLTEFLAAFVPEKTAQQYLARTSALSVGIVYENVRTITIASSGSYPVGLSGFLFSEKDGWEKRTALSKEYTGQYYHSHAVDVVLKKHTAFSLVGDGSRSIDRFLYRIAHPQIPVFPSRFQRLLTVGETGEIGLYARSARCVAAFLFGLQDIELPIKSIELYLKKNTDSAYLYSAVFETTHNRVAAVLKILLRNALHGTVSVQDASVFVEDASISEAELLTFFHAFADIR